jgi:hypothetical protein
VGVQITIIMDIKYIDCSISKELQEFLDFRDEVMEEFYIFANKILMIPKEYFNDSNNLSKV